MIDAPFKTSEFLEPAKDWKFYVLVVFALVSPALKFLLCFSDLDCCSAMVPHLRMPSHVSATLL